MIAELVNDLVHLKSSQDGLDQNGASDGASRHANVVLGKVKDVVPESRFKMRFHLGQVEVRACASLDEFAGVREKVQTKVKQRTRNGFAIDSEMLLFEMPASWSGNERGQYSVRAELILFLSCLEVNLLANSAVTLLAPKGIIGVGSSRAAARLTRIG